MRGENISTIKVTAIGKSGDGVGALGDDTVYVPFALPGETVNARLLPAQNKGARSAPRQAVLQKATTPSAERRPPVCRHFGQCGGCQLQHWDLAPYREWKSALAFQHMSRNGLEPERVHPLVCFPTAARRRVDFDIVFDGAQPRLGFRARNSRRFVPVQSCAVLLPELNKAQAALQTELLPIWGDRAGENKKRGQSRGRDAKDWAVRMTMAANGIDVALIGGADPQRRIPAMAAVAQAQNWARLTWTPAPARAPQDLLVYRKPVVDFSGYQVPLPPLVFLQASREAEVALTATVMDHLPEEPGHILDLFCGLGPFSFAAARRHKVTAADNDGPALAGLETGARHASGAKPIIAEKRNLLKQVYSADALSEFSAVILDPPRAGAHRQCAELADASVPAIIMVSCNPESFARDAQLLTAGGYRFQDLYMFDQFQWTPHIELIGIFRRV